MRILFLVCIVLSGLSSSAQSYHRLDSALTKRSSASAIRFKSVIAPSILTVYGISSLVFEPIRDLDISWNRSMQEGKSVAQFRADDYILYIPAITVYALDMAGIKGQHNWKEQTGRLVLAHMLSTSIIAPAKMISNRSRPDGSDDHSFPSGHTTRAFVHAEFLWQEYKDVNPWLASSGYAFAAATGYLRMYNNRHWFSDVMAGAGIGILSTKVSYWLYPKISKAIFGKYKKYMVLMPGFQQKQFRLQLATRL